MGIITTYPDDDATTADDKFLTSDSSGATKLTTADTLKSYILADGNVETSTLAESAVTTSKIDDGAVTSAKTTGIWWEELGRTTLSVASDTISVTSIAARRYLKVLFFVAATSGTINSRLQFNNDTGNNYAERSSSNGGADGTSSSNTNVGLTQSASTNFRYGEATILNVATQEKLVIGHVTEAGISGAGNVPTRAEMAGKWANTSNQITRIDLINIGTGDFAIGSEVVILGHN